MIPLLLAQVTDVKIVSPDTEAQITYFFIGFCAMIPLMIIPLITHWSRRAAKPLGMPTE